MPSSVAAFGEWMCTGRPFQISSPLVGCQIPAMVLISVDLPAPLSPTSAVTWPAGMSRLMSVRACTGPKLLLISRSRSSGVSPDSAGLAFGSSDPDGTRPVLPGRVPSPERSVTTALLPLGRFLSSLRDTVLRAVRGERARAQLGCWHEAVLDDRGLDRAGRDPLRGQQDRLDHGSGADVLRRAVDQGRRRREARPDVH